jgi:putative transposase
VALLLDVELRPTDAPATRAHEGFVDMAPPSVHATLLNDGTFLASVLTMYRILRSVAEVMERPASGHTSFLREGRSGSLDLGRFGGPNLVWSWDITNLRGPVN